MAGEVKFTVQGVKELRAALLSITPKLRRQALRNALAAGARVIRDEARRRAPTLKASTYYGASALRRGVRAVGTLKKAISVRTSKVSSRRGDVGVFVNVRPAKGGDRGARSPRDPFYWRFLEFGWKPARGSRLIVRRLLQRGNSTPVTSKPGARFLQLSVSKQGDALRKIEQTLGPQIRRLNTKGASL